MHDACNRFLINRSGIIWCEQHDDEQLLQLVEATPLHLAAAEIAADMQADFGQFIVVFVMSSDQIASLRRDVDISDPLPLQEAQPKGT